MVGVPRQLKHRRGPWRLQIPEKQNKTKHQNLGSGAPCSHSLKLSFPLSHLSVLMGQYQVSVRKLFGLPKVWEARIQLSGCLYPISNKPTNKTKTLEVCTGVHTQGPFTPHVLCTPRALGIALYQIIINPAAVLSAWGE